MAVALAVVALTLVASPRVARAQVWELRHDLAVDVPVTAGAVGVMVAVEIFKDHLAPQRCRWCDSDPSGRDVLNPVDKGMRDLCRWADMTTARRLSDFSAFLLTPATSMGTMLGASLHDDAGAKFPMDMLFVLQATAVSGVVTDAVKLAVGRERPFVHVLSENQKPTMPHPSDNNLSFYSGHTSYTFAIAAASGTIASLRGYRGAGAVWGSLVPLAVATGYLRIAGDRHYFLDVLGGAIFGAAVGVLIPVLLHPRERREEGVLAGDGVPSGPVPASRPPLLSLSGAF